MLSHANEGNEIQRNLKICTDTAIVWLVLFIVITELSEMGQSKGEIINFNHWRIFDCIFRESWYIKQIFKSESAS